MWGFTRHLLPQRRLRDGMGGADGNACIVYVPGMGCAMAVGMPGGADPTGMIKLAMGREEEDFFTGDLLGDFRGDVEDGLARHNIPCFRDSAGTHPSERHVSRLCLN